MTAKTFKIIGNILIVIVILACLPVAIPKLLGLQGYDVISGSMEPSISVGSIVYVKNVEFQELTTGDVIAFEAGASVVTHRIVEIDEADKLFTTKGDANEANDFMPVAYVNVIGKVVAHFPLYGYVAAWISELTGKVVLAVMLILGVIISSVGDKSSEDGGATKPKRRKGPLIILCSGLLIIVSALGGFLYIFYGYQKSESLYEAVEEAYVTETVDVDKSIPWYEMLDVDFESLQAINPDVIGWIYVEGTDISYPIMYAGDDETYLHTTLDRQYAKAGSIFMEGMNDSSFGDSHSILYGHNMKNLSMFGKLRYYKAEEEYLDNHKYFQIITPSGKMRFEIFSYFDTDPASWVYEIPFGEGDAFDSYLAELRRHSYRKIETEREVTSSDKVITLSTCSSNERRFVVNGYMVENR